MPNKGGFLMKKFLLTLKNAFSLELDKASNEEIRETIIQASNFKGTNLFILMLAIFIASIGLNMNSTAVIIGAMLISPLMGGIMAIGFGMATNDLKLVRKAFIGLLFQVVICIATSALYFSISPISAARSELLARTTPTIWDVLIAICGGLAGIIGVTRKEKSNVIPGVAIATALMPPLCTVGYGIAAGNLTYSFGAAYLFFINSFFICISTFTITRLMRIPKKSFLDAEAEKRVKRYVYLIGLITVIPSIYLGYQIVKDTVQDNNIENFIQTEFVDNTVISNDTQVISKYVDKKNNEIRIALLGKRLSNDVISVVADKLKQYSLSHMSLKVTQNESVESLKYEDIEALIQKELDETTTQIAMGDRDKEIEMLKAELVKYKALVMDYQASDYDVATLTSELRALYPIIENFSIGKVKGIDKATKEPIYRIVATVDTKSTLSSVEKMRIIDWLTVKTNTEDVELYVNTLVAPPINTSPYLPQEPTDKDSNSHVQPLNQNE